MKFQNKIILIFAAVILSAGIVFVPAASLEAGMPFYINAEAASGVSAPVADQESGLHIMDSEKLKVNFSCSTKDAVIYYKVNAGSYKKYTRTLAVTKNMKISAYAELDGKKSKVVTYDYRLGANYKLSILPGEFASDQTLKITPKVPGTTLYYTLDGTKATAKSDKVPAGGIKLTSTSTISVHAEKSGWSGVGNTYTYKINKTDKYKEYHYYNQLSDKEKGAYERIYSVISDGGNHVVFKGLGLNTDNVNKILMAFNNDICEFAGLNIVMNWPAYSFQGNECTAVTFKYDGKSAEAVEKQKKFDKKVSQIVAEAKKQSTDYGKLKYIHDWLVNNSRWETDESNSDVYLLVRRAEGPVLNGKGVCGGYSFAFCHLARELGYECIYIQGNYGAHAWNMVKVNGQWYNIDVSFDDQDMNGNYQVSYKWFLKGDDYFGTEHIRQNQDGWEFFTYPDSAKDYAA